MTSRRSDTPGRKSPVVLEALPTAASLSPASTGDLRQQFDKPVADRTGVTIRRCDLRPLLDHRSDSRPLAYDSRFRQGQPPPTGRRRQDRPSYRTCHGVPHDRHHGLRSLFEWHRSRQGWMEPPGPCRSRPLRHRPPVTVRQLNGGPPHHRTQPLPLVTPGGPSALRILQSQNLTPKVPYVPRPCAGLP